MQMRYRLQNKRYNTAASNGLNKISIIVRIFWFDRDIYM